MESKVFDPSLMENRFRHEFKYLSTLGQLKTIQVRLTGLIPLDPHVGPDGIYNIRSLYFDDYEDRYLKKMKPVWIQEKSFVSGSTITATVGSRWN